MDNQFEEITLSNVIFPCDCNICGELLRDAIHSQSHMKEHFGQMTIKTEVPKKPFILESNEDETDEDEDDTPPQTF